MLLTLLELYNIQNFTLPSYCEQNLNLKTESKIKLLVTFIQWFVTQRQLSLIFIIFANKTLLCLHKMAYFSMPNMTHTRKQMATRSFV